MSSVYLCENKGVRKHFFLAKRLIISTIECTKSFDLSYYDNKNMYTRRVNTDALLLRSSVIGIPGLAH